LEVLEDVVTIPTEAVQVGQSGEYVYALDAELKATLRPVRTGATVGALVVIEEGLAAGESVVTEGHLRVTEGAAVKLLDAEAPVEPPAP
jgi:multidrug efflux system membrane fusion protein